MRWWVDMIYIIYRPLNIDSLLQVVTSLTEIAYLLNLRGGDFRYVPVFRAYLIVSQEEVILYTNKSKIHLDVEIKLNFDFKTNACHREACVMWAEH